MSLAPPQRQKDLKTGKPDVQVRQRPTTDEALQVDGAVALPSWRKLAGVDAKPGGDQPDLEAKSKQDAARAAGRVDGSPGPKRSSELRDQVADAEQAAREGRVPTKADALADATAAERAAAAEERARVSDPELTALRRARGPPVAESEAFESVARSVGHSLSRGAVGAYAAHWGEDFTGVVVHADAAASHAAELLAAEALTIGEHIYFARGRYAPGSTRGAALLAHELAHVVQLRTGQLAHTVGVSDPGSPVERVADSIVASRGVPVVSGVRESGGGGARAPPAPGIGRIAPLVLRRATDGAKEFFHRGYFQQAAGWGDASANLDAQLTADTSADTAAFPSPTAALGPEEAVVPPVVAPAAALSLESEIPVPAEGSAAPSVVEADGDSGTAPALPALGSLTVGEDGDSSAAQARLDGALDNVPTEFDVRTSPGEPPALALEDSADPAQTEEQETVAQEQARSLQQQAAAAVEQGPGAEQVQPGSLHETSAVPAPEAGTLEPFAEIPGMAEMQANPIPEEVRAETDSAGQEQLTATMAESDAALDAASVDHEARTQEEVTRAEEEQERLNQEADAAQNAEVDRARGEISGRRDAALEQQQAAVDGLDEQSTTERDRALAEIDTRVAADERAIDDEYQTAERDAEAEKLAKEQQARTKKEEAERKSQDQSWWESALDAIASFFNELLDVVNGLFDALVEAVGAIIEAAKKAVVAIVDALRDFAVFMVRAYGEFLKFLVDTLLADIFPELAAALNELIDAAVQLAVDAINWVADRLKAGLLALLDSINAAILALLAALREAINMALRIAQAALAGDWAALGKLVLEAALKLAGIPPESFYELANSALSAIDTIIADPGAFVGNLINAMASGFQSFADNILTHLQEGFFAWIVGPLAELGLTLPTSWDFKGIFGLVLQVLGITRESMRQVVTEELGETAGLIFDFVWRYVGALIEGGLEGLWNEIQNDLGMLWGMVVDGIKSWLIETIVKQAVIRIATMFNPVGALINALITVWNVLTWLRDNVQRIYGVVQAVVTMLASIAAGVIQPAAQAVERSLASLIPIAISLLANLLGLGGITAKVRELLEGVRGFVREAIRALIRRVKALFTGGQEEEEAEDEEDPDGNATLASVAFSANTGPGGQAEPHRVYAQAAGDRPTVMVASGGGAPIEQQVSSGEFKNMPEGDKSEALANAENSESKYEASNDAETPEAASQAEQEADAEIAAAATNLAKAEGALESTSTPAPMVGGSETVDVKVAEGEVTVSIGGGDKASKVEAVLAFVSGAKNSAGKALVQQELTAIEQLVTALPDAEDQEKVEEGAKQIATHVSTIGSRMKIASLSRGATTERITPPVTREFTRLVSDSPQFQTKWDSEFDRQLKNQEEGLNKMTIDTWVVNFDAYQFGKSTAEQLEGLARQAVLEELRRRATQKLEAVNSRKAKWQAALTAIGAASDPAAEPDMAVLAVVTGRFDNLAEVWRKNRPLIKEVIASGAAQWSDIGSGFAILHNADQIAGGAGQIKAFDNPPSLGPNPTPEEAQQWLEYVRSLQAMVGPANINSSIGSQWKQQVDGLRGDITGERPEEAWAIWMLDVSLQPK